MSGRRFSDFSPLGMWPLLLTKGPVNKLPGWKVTRLQNGSFSLNYIHFEITGDPWNLIGPKWCNLFPNCTFFCSKLHPFFSPSKWKWSNTNHHISFSCLVAHRALIGIATLSWWGGLRAPVTPRAMLAGVLYSWQGHPCQTGQRVGARQRVIPLALQVGGWAEGW